MKEFEYKKENIEEIKKSFEKDEEVIINFIGEWKVIYIHINSSGEYEYDIYSMDTFDLDEPDYIEDGGCYDEIDWEDLKSLF